MGSSADPVSGPLVTVWFSLIGDDFDPSEAAAMVGLQPSRMWRKGEPMGRLGRTHRKTSGIWFQVGPEATFHAHEIIDRLLQWVEPRREGVFKVLEDLGASASVDCEMRILDADRSTPSLSLDADLVARIRALRAAIDVDILIFDPRLDD